MRMRRNEINWDGDDCRVEIISIAVVAFILMASIFAAGYAIGSVAATKRCLDAREDRRIEAETAFVNLLNTGRDTLNLRHKIATGFADEISAEGAE